MVGLCVGYVCFSMMCLVVIRLIVLISWFFIIWGCACVVNLFACFVQLLVCGLVSLFVIVGLRGFLLLAVMWLAIVWCGCLLLSYCRRLIWLFKIGGVVVVFVWIGCIWCCVLVCVPLIVSRLRLL